MLSNDSISLVLSKNDKEINVIDLFRELHDVTNVNSTIQEQLSPKPSSNPILNYKISTREKEILKLILEEYTSQEIGDKLFISTRTVDLHRGKLLSKLGAKNSLGLARIAYKFNLI